MGALSGVDGRGNSASFIFALFPTVVGGGINIKKKEFASAREKIHSCNCVPRLEGLLFSGKQTEGHKFFPFLIMADEHEFVPIHLKQGRFSK